MKPLLITAALIAAVTAPLAAQDDELSKLWQTLRRRLDAGESGLRAEFRLPELDAFLRAHGATHAAALPVLEARARRGSLHLIAFEPSRAEADFREVLARAPTAAIELRGHALCGLAECAELRGDQPAALEFWLRAERDLAGTRWSDIARIATERLQLRPRPRCRAGDPLPELAPVLDVKRTAHRVADLRGKPAMLLFVSAVDADAQTRLDRSVRAARTAGLGDEQMIAFMIDAQGRDLETLARSRGWRMPIVPSSDGFVGEALLAFEVRGVPATILVGPDGTILARDLPASRFGEVLGGRRR